MTPGALPGRRTAGAGHHHRRARLHRRVGIVSAAALLLGALPLLRALEPPRRADEPALAGLGSDLGVVPGAAARDLPGFRPVEARSGAKSAGERGAAAKDEGGGRTRGGFSDETARTLRRMADESPQGPRLYALLEDAPTERAIAMLLTAAGVRFRMESGVTGRVTLRPVEGPNTAAQALARIFPANVGPRLGLTREGDTYVVRPEASPAEVPPPGAASPGAPAPQAQEAPRNDRRDNTTAGPPASGGAPRPKLPPAPRGYLPLEPDGTIRRVAGIIVLGRAPVVALLETVPPGGTPVFDNVRPGERIAPGLPGSEPYRAEGVQVEGIILRGRAGQTVLVPLAPRSSPILRVGEEQGEPREARAPRSDGGMSVPRGGWEQEAGEGRVGRPGFWP